MVEVHQLRILKLVTLQGFDMVTSLCRPCGDPESCTDRKSPVVPLQKGVWCLVPVGRGFSPEQRVFPRLPDRNFLHEQRILFHEVKLSKKAVQPKTALSLTTKSQRNHDDQLPLFRGLNFTRVAPYSYTIHGRSI